MNEFKNFYGKGPEWGHKDRRLIFNAACKYLGINPTQVDNIYGVGFHSIMQSNSIQLTGGMLEKVRKDQAIINN